MIYEAVSETVCNFCGPKPIASGWKKRIDKDFKKQYYLQRAIHRLFRPVFRTSEKKTISDTYFSSNGLVL